MEREFVKNFQKNLFQKILFHSNVWSIKNLVLCTNFVHNSVHVSLVFFPKCVDWSKVWNALRRIFEDGTVPSLQFLAQVVSVRKIET